MPYIMVMGSIIAHLSKDEGATVYGLKREEQATLVKDLNSSSSVTIATISEMEGTVRVKKELMTLIVVNRIHVLFGYDVVSHSMAMMPNANRELLSFTMYRKTNSHGHAQGGSHTTHKCHEHAQSMHKSHSNGSVVTL